MSGEGGFLGGAGGSGSGTGGGTGGAGPDWEEASSAMAERSTSSTTHLMEIQRKAVQVHTAAWALAAPSLPLTAL